MFIDLHENISAETRDAIVTLGYCFIGRSAVVTADLPSTASLSTSAQQLFHRASHEKSLWTDHYLRSIQFTDRIHEKESLTFSSVDQLENNSAWTFLLPTLKTCETLRTLLGQHFPSTTTNASHLQLIHYRSADEKILFDSSSFNAAQYHLHLSSTLHLEYFHSLDQQWKRFPQSDQHLLVTFPDLPIRCRQDDLCLQRDDYTITYSFSLLPPVSPRPRTYLLSLTENTVLRYFTFFYLYAMQGVPTGFSSTALANYLTAEGEQSSTVGTFVSLSGLPWGLQFVWGPLIDRYQDGAMGRRRPWVIFSQTCAFLASLGLLFVRNPPTSSIQQLVIAFFIHSIFASIQDASVDAQAISTISVKERGRINGVMRAGFLIGSALGSAGLSWVLRHRGYFPAALINSTFLFVFTFITFFVKERSSDHLLPCQRKKKTKKCHEENPSGSSSYSIGRLFVELFKGLFSWTSLRLYLPILLAYTCQSIFIRAYNIHLIKVLGWSDTSVSILSGAWGTLIVVFVAVLCGYVADRIGARVLLLLVLCIHTLYLFVSNLLYAYWIVRPVATTILILWSMMDPILSAAAMPVLMSLCRKHVEGSQFTTYMSLINLCDLFGAFLSGHLQQVFRANVIGVACAVSLLVSLIIVSISLYVEKRHNRVIEVTDGLEKHRTTSFFAICSSCPFSRHRRSLKITVQA